MTETHPNSVDPIRRGIIGAATLTAAASAIGLGGAAAASAGPGFPSQLYTGPYAHRLITGGVGHNLPQEAPAAFAQAIFDVDHL